jgi:hypothetical protein
MDTSRIKDADNIIDRPSRNTDGYRQLSSWVEEAIWGHRLWYRQTPWLLFLEFLNIAEYSYRQNKLFSGDITNSSPTYQFHQRLALRNILFNNSALSSVADSEKADSSKWDDWVKYMNDEQAPTAVSPLDFAYLRQRFPRFRDFAKSVELLRQTVIEPDANRRWSSCFVFPFGPAVLYEDLNITATKTERQYINFGRTGDLLYMMICRSSLSSDLAVEFARLLNGTTVGNRLAYKLLPQDGRADISEQRGSGYLPYRKHPAYDRLAKDWLSLLRLGLPAQDAYAHLAPLAALHVLIYQMETATAWLNRQPPTFVCEVIAPKMEFVRQRATGSYLQNDGLLCAAVDRFAREFFSSDIWKKHVDDTSLLSESERVEAAVDILDAQLWIDKGSLGNSTTVEDLKEQVLRELHDKADGNVRLVHSAYGRNCGLVSKRGTINYRYAPTDSLLKTLVLANVDRRMEITEFLHLLFSRYGMIFGSLEAEAVLPAVDYNQSAFCKNRARLEERLRSMGLLNRLSDDCAYVENPLR